MVRDHSRAQRDRQKSKESRGCASEVKNASPTWRDSRRGYVSRARTAPKLADVLEDRLRPVSDVQGIGIITTETDEGDLAEIGKPL